MGMRDPLQPSSEVTAGEAPGWSAVPRPLPKPGSTRDRSASAHRPRVPAQPTCAGQRRSRRMQLGAVLAGRSCAAALDPLPAFQSGGQGEGAMQRGGSSHLLFPELCPLENGMHSSRCRSTSQNRAASLIHTSDCHQLLSPAAPRNAPPCARALPRQKRLPPGLSSEPHPAAVGKRCPPL